MKLTFKLFYEHLVKLINFNKSKSLLSPYFYLT